MIKRISFTLLILISIMVLSLYLLLASSLPNLSGSREAAITAPATLQRDTLGNAVITAENRPDAAYLLGFAHAQDRLFQMDLLRRSAAGELSELFGDAALPTDKRVRFHEFRMRAQRAVSQLSVEEQGLLNAYARGVNDATATLTLLPFEYLLTDKPFTAWKPEDSLLASYSMYIDLQHIQVDRDLTLTRIRHHFGQPMVDFLVRPSSYQAALDGSVVPLVDSLVPQLNPTDDPNWAYQAIEEPIDIGSNNWAVGPLLTEGTSGLLSDDMHLGLRVPPIWYRTALRYTHNGEAITLDGVSLPGSPAVIVGTNGHVAWGFTNANLDNTDWIALAPETPITSTVQQIMSADGTHDYVLEHSELGPVKRFGDQVYALRWTAHMPYAVNVNIADLDSVKDVFAAQAVATSMGIPVQNMVAADTLGNIAWMPAGAITARPMPSNAAIPEAEYSPLWAQRETELPSVINPEQHRIWTANARVISTQQLARFGDGGYAVGARGLQIRNRLYERERFDEQAFYAIQLDNEAQFLSPWHQLLMATLSQSPNEFADDIATLRAWQGCACAESVGYTLVRTFRTQVINQLFAPLENKLQEESLSLRPILRHVEPAVWDLLQQQPMEWLPDGADNWTHFLMQRYRQARIDLLDKHNDGKSTENIAALKALSWGEVNQLHVQHPFSQTMPFLSPFLDMRATPGFGDSFMPAVQNGTHGASQRFIIQPGNPQNAIMTIPGGQSGHPLSEYYKRGFDEYITNQPTPLLPGDIEHTLSFTPTRLPQP
ncbi:penicillin acylase family protein [Alteromonas oceanisediminis]|uniref:penicillin acylase family protein n=1 Tax=Alteromonas oceanisediminis TaxID=2836180 RepID=UPI002023B75F|nr:penicillin acylase family protein [Alteromonas oceanisediminis]